MKKVAIISNLPSGGARTVLNSTKEYLSKKYYTEELGKSVESYTVNGIIRYYYSVIQEIIYNYKVSKLINQEFDILLAYQSWLTKSPIIFPFITIPIVYICHEVPREHYDPQVTSKHTIKEQVINRIFLYPIKLIDRLNLMVHNNNLTIVTLSKISGDMIRKTYNIKPRIIHPGISLKGYGKYSGYNNRYNQVITVGAINKYKNQLFVLESISQIPVENRPKVIIVGNGGDAKYIADLRKYARLKSIKIDIRIGISKSTLIKLYKSSYALMYSPVNEPYGLVVIEGMRAGLPIIASKGGGYEEIINSSNGYILRQDAKLWASAYMKLYKNRELWEKYSQQNYTDSTNFSDLKYSQKIASIIDRLI